MKKILTKKRIFWTSFLGTLFMVIIVMTWNSCYEDLQCRNSFYFDFFGKADWLLFFPAIFVMSLFTIKANDRVFNSYLRFAYWWTPLSALIIFTTPTASHSWAIGGPTRQTMLFVMSGLFLTISLGIVSWKYFSLGKNRH